MDRSTDACYETQQAQLEKLIRELFQQEDLGPEEMHEMISLILAEYCQYPDFYESTHRQKKIRTFQQLLRFLADCKRCLQSER